MDTKLLGFNCNSGFANTPQYCVIGALPVLFFSYDIIETVAYDGLIFYFHPLTDEWISKTNGMILKNTKYSDKVVFHCHFLHQKYHMDCPGLSPGFSYYQEATDGLRYGMVLLFSYGLFCTSLSLNSVCLWNWMGYLTRVWISPIVKSPCK